MNNEELDAILEDLEKNGLMKVVQKQGMFGPKTEIHPTDKGLKNIILDFRFYKINLITYTL